ncbi:hypothetical protein DW019_08175 [Clostridium sp. AF37-5]|uniref:hypothetical protein n=1 Tax=Clostridium sp. AF37-5 TaxID=2293016 RepID=UPI000E4C4D93|nr:hypothetical protein [Clostridium sp. AF37-5]RHO97815.1 hypothetical protein DW019_08175 [Clostridium sp. AF37-5]
MKNIMGESCLSCRENIESGMGELSLRKPKRKEIGIAAAVVLVMCLLAGTSIIIRNHQNQKKLEEKKEEVYQSLSATDRETADLYAELYETDREEVAKIQAETKDWEKTGRKLEQDFFTIPENTKYQMEQEGYSLDDLEQAEKLSVKTGRKAIELAKEKGKTSENRQWFDVVKDSEILSTEEQLGLSKEQIQQLKDKSLSKEERIEVAVLLLNETYSFGEVLKELDAGKTVEELEK